MNIKYQTIESGILGGLIGSVIGTIIPSIGPLTGLVLVGSLGVLTEHFDFLRRVKNQPLQTTYATCNQMLTSSYARMILKGLIKTTLPCGDDALIQEEPENSASLDSNVFNDNNYIQDEEEPTRSPFSL
jgi:hypothetical protein